MKKPCKELTIIIPFLNEGNEVFNTIESINNSIVYNNIDILLINDASDDKYDYESVAKKFQNVIYFKNKERQGIANSRDFGISVCETPYFLLLDAHMRFYDNTWVDRIVEELNKNDRVVLCAQTIRLKLENDKITRYDQYSYGAFLNLDSKKYFQRLIWINNINKFDSLNKSEIPNILGAGYAASKRYWQYLRGVRGLKSYGSDEEYLSIKVWLEGGKCKLLEDVEIGHIYRANPPYKVETYDIFYNKLLVAYLLFPDNFKKKSFNVLKESQTVSFYNQVFSIFYTNREEIVLLKEYYNSILYHDFHKILLINNYHKTLPWLNSKKDYLHYISSQVILNLNNSSDIGLLKGKIGITLFLFHYAIFTGVVFFNELAEMVLFEILDNLDEELLVNMINGYCGIAWALCYLIDNGFVDGEKKEVLADLNCKIMERNPVRIKDTAFETGFAGILFYVSEIGKDFFDEEYIQQMNNKILELLNLPDFLEKKDADIIMDYGSYFIGHTSSILNHINIFDFINLDMPKQEELKYLPINLQGIAGIGLNLILSYDKFN